MKSDEIEEVTDEMLKMLVEDNPHVAVLFCKKYRYNVNVVLEPVQNKGKN